MKLSSLTIKGFKSFKNETKFHFNESVTGVVGPNGAGKSNVVDAIRWVLGEQKSKELRLGRMSEVIFNGTKSIKKSSSATVTLTFDNTKNVLPTEYNTLAISRTLFRNGDSEYRLNDVVCRLKDITSLFLDTGIGSNSYAIIELGMVDDILQDKDNARRKMFEQAAGIAKYKVRKKETENKLRSTNDDLDRVEDLLAEIENNLKTLERQAKRTKKFYEIKDEHKNLSLELTAIEFQELQNAIQKLKAQILEEKNNYSKIQNAINTEEAEIEKLKKSNLDTEKLLSNSQKEISGLVDEIRKKENESNILKEKINFNDSDSKRIHSDLERVQPRVKHLRDEIDNINEQLKALEPNFKEITAAYAELEKMSAEKQKNFEREREEITRLASIEKEKSNKIFELEKEKSNILGQISNLESQKANLQRDIPEIEASLLALKSQFEEESELKSQIQVKIDKAIKEEETRISELEEIESKVEKSDATISEINRTLDAKRNEFKLTKSMIENLEGYPQSTKFLKNSFKQDLVFVSDILSCSKQYKTPLEFFLEPYLSYLVVNTEKDALKAIGLLKESQKGKAKFFVLSKVNGKNEKPELFKNLTPLIDIVECDKKYKGLANLLLHGAYVKDGEIDGTYPPDITVISSGADIMIRGEAYSGGSVGLFEGKKIGRIKDLGKLEKEISKLESQVQKLDKEHFKLKAKREHLAAKSNAEELKSLNYEFNQINQSVIILEQKIAGLRSNITINTSQLDTNFGVLENFRTDISKIEQTISNINSGDDNALKSNWDDQLMQLNLELQDCYTQFNEKKIEMMQVKNDIDNGKAKVINNEAAISAIINESEDLKLQLERNKELIEKWKQEIQGMDSDLKLLYEKQKTKTSSLGKVEEDFFTNKNRIYDLEDKVRKLNTKRNDNQVLINELRSKRQGFEFKITAIFDRVEVEFKVDQNDIKKREIDKDVDVEALKEKVTKLTIRLNNFGEINPLALEAYDEIKQRFEDITQQRDDILEAKVSLLETIQEIEATAKTQFTEAFNQIRANFKEIFTVLFDEGDECDLILEDEDRPLDSKIEITAKPKGKRPLTINLLSGGEKTLTSTALLFALYLMKPAPFCIFDEVDAPLDDVNVIKFNKIIRKFSKDSQFIIVTHNKLTMEMMDVMYGVFMAEAGVSSTSQIDFREFKESGVMEATS